MTDREEQWLALHLVRGLGRVGLVRLMQRFGSPEAILDADAQLLGGCGAVRREVAEGIAGRDAALVRRTREGLERLGVRIVSLWDEDYPALLRQMHDPPALLYLRGCLPRTEGLAVVGARKASAAGLRLTERLCAELAARGIPVVSGLARGIDSAAHRGALMGEGVTLAVLGCGIDRLYPPENDRLFRQILEQGAVLSEYPPGTPPLANHFPGRNRIISGLCRGVLVIEAAEESGSLITADFALEQGREVFAVPGPVDSPTSAGPHRLLKDGAHLVTEVRDLLDVLWPNAPSPVGRKVETRRLPQLPEPAAALFSLLESGPLTTDELIRRSGLTPMEVSDSLLHLELEGAVRQAPGMRYVRVT